MTPPSIVQSILTDPADALITLHRLADMGKQDADVAALQESLPGMLEIAGENLLARLAEAYHLISRGQSDQELLLVGLRKLRAGLSDPGAQALHHANEAARLYSLCEQAIEAETIAAITDLLPALQSVRSEDKSFELADLADTLHELIPAAKSLFAYERVDSTQDRLAYLAATIEHLHEVDRKARVLGATDSPIVQRIVDRWLAIATSRLGDLKTRAQITCQLVTHRTWQSDSITLALRLHNQGHGTALNLRVSLSEDPGYSLLDGVVIVDRLVAGDEIQVELRLRPRQEPGGTHFRARFIVLYDDLRGSNQVEHYADLVHLVAPEGAFQFIPNPYVIGTPLKMGSPLFFGREDVFSFIQENFAAAHHNNLVLIGQRRTGKSSLLKQLPLRLGEGYVPVYLDGQSIALDPGLPAFFLNLAMEISYALEDRGVSFEAPSLSDFAERPAYHFERSFLRRVRKAIGDRHLTLLLDEFEELGSAVRRGTLDDSVFGFLRHLIQHGEGISMIFCGTHRLEELPTDYWSVLLNVSLYRHIGFLTYPEAVGLIQDPVAPFGLRYDDLALDKIWHVTSGHPYFLQLLCHSLVNHHNRSQRSYVTVADVNAALDEIMATGEAHFAHLWTESTSEERLILTALSRMMTLTGRVTPAQVSDYLAERGIALDRQTIGNTLHRLTLRDILAAKAGSGGIEFDGSYRWQLGLLGLWVEKYKSLGRLREETRP